MAEHRNRHADKWARIKDADVNLHHSSTEVLADMSKVYPGEKAASSINRADKTGVPK